LRKAEGRRLGWSMIFFLAVLGALFPVEARRLRLPGVIFIYEAHTDVGEGGVILRELADVVAGLPSDVSHRFAIIEDTGLPLFFLLQQLYPGRRISVEEIDEILQDPEFIAGSRDVMVMVTRAAERRDEEIANNPDAINPERSRDNFEKLTLQVMKFFADNEFRIIREITSQDASDPEVERVWRAFLESQALEWRARDAFHRGDLEEYAGLIKKYLQLCAWRYQQRDAFLNARIKSLREEYPDSVIVTVRGAFHIPGGLALQEEGYGVDLRIPRDWISEPGLVAQLLYYYQGMREELTEPEEDLIFKYYPVKLLQEKALEVTHDYYQSGIVAYELLKGDRFTTEEVEEFSRALQERFPDAYRYDYTSLSKQVRNFAFNWFLSRGKIGEEYYRYFLPPLALTREIITEILGRRTPSRIVAEIYARGRGRIFYTERQIEEFVLAAFREISP